MIVLGIVGSPRKDGNTHLMMEEALRAAGESGAVTDLFTVHGKNIAGCEAVSRTQDDEWDGLNRIVRRAASGCNPFLYPVLPADLRWSIGWARPESPLCPGWSPVVHKRLRGSSISIENVAG